MKAASVPFVVQLIDPDPLPDTPNYLTQWFSNYGTGEMSGTP